MGSGLLGVPPTSSHLASNSWRTDLDTRQVIEGTSVALPTSGLAMGLTLVRIVWPVGNRPAASAHRFLEPPIGRVASNGSRRLFGSYRRGCFVFYWGQVSHRRDLGISLAHVHTGRCDIGDSRFDLMGKLRDPRRGPRSGLWRWQSRCRLCPHGRGALRAWPAVVSDLECGDLCGRGSWS